MINDEITREDELDENQNDSDTTQEAEHENEQQDEKDWKAEALKYKIILDRNRDAIRELEKNNKEKKPSKQSEGLDYGVKAFLVANGLKGEQEFKLAQEFSRNTGKSLDDVIDSKYFQQELADYREQKTTQDASIKGRGKTSNVAQNDVEYWLAKPFGELPDDFELRSKVVKARRAKSKNTGMFTRD